MCAAFVLTLQKECQSVDVAEQMKTLNCSASPSRSDKSKRALWGKKQEETPTSVFFT